MLYDINKQYLSYINSKTNDNRLWYLIKIDIPLSYDIKVNY
jgi:hypothetical protein